MAARQQRVRSDGTIAHRVVYRTAGKQRVETFDNAHGADVFEDHLKEFGPAVALELLAAATRTRINVVPVTDWVAHHIELISNITNGTRGTYRSMNTRLIATDAVGRMPVDQLDRATVERWVISLHRDRHLSNKSIRNVQGLLSAAMTRAVRDGVRGSNPAADVKAPSTARAKEKVYLTGSEFAVFLSHIPAFYRDFVATLYGTGLRFGEATALRVRDVDLAGDPPVLVVSQAWRHHVAGPREIGAPKSNAGRRTVALPDPLPALLRAHVEGRHPDEYVFVNHHGRPIRANTFHATTWKKAVDRAEPLIHKRATPHSMRHSHVSNLIRSGIPLNVIQRRLGHEKITTTVDTYGHLADDHLSIAAQAAALSLVEAFPEIEASEDLPDDAHHVSDELANG